MKLVIVESPAKCTTIQRYLGPDYIVKASLGHIRDLATSGEGGLGVDVKNGFTPTYIINKDKVTVVRELQKLARSSEEVILATDPDREGEAIAWHLANVLKLDIDTNKRWEFHEITRDSITNAMNNPRVIDKNLVASQETRRILDRIIGFKLSNLLYKKIRSRSAGRVQSATLKLIYEREKEIENFVPEEYYNILCQALIFGKDFDLKLSSVDGKNIEIKNEESANAILSRLGDKVKVISAKKYVKSIQSDAPFTTSTLQQEAFSKLKFKTKKTQYIAQTLYEGIEINGEHIGLITYMRTDSSRLSPTFISRATDYISKTMGEQYVGHPKHLKNIGLMQDAHEAIRPTHNHSTPESIRKYLSPDQFALYRLIYNRTLASLMSDKKEEILSLVLENNGIQFTLSFSRTIFDGFTHIYKDEKKDDIEIPSINVGDEFFLSKKEKEQKFTQPPAHYSEAKIVKKMAEVGIGRPSTYASTIDILQKRRYVNNDAGILTITETGKRTAHVLEKYFPDIVNVKYTASMEDKLDHIQAGNESRLKILTDFYYPFIEEVKDGFAKMYPEDNKPTGNLCPKCGAPLVYKEGKKGLFVGCSNFPKCKYVEKEKKPEPVYLDEVCPHCGKPLVERKDKRGNTLICCSGYPACHYVKPDENSASNDNTHLKKCPDCEDGYLIRKKGKYGYFLGCSNYPKCKHMEKIYKRRGKK